MEFSEKCPDNYQGWWGLLICRTRNFTIKDNNILFENDIKSYYNNFKKTAPDAIRADYSKIVENYLHPIPQNTATTYNNKTQMPQINVPQINLRAIPIIFGILFMLSGLAKGCGFCLILAGVFSNKETAKKCGLTEQERKILLGILYVSSVVLFFAFGKFN